MAENKKILNNLIKSDKKFDKKNNEVPTGNDDEVLITTSRVVSIRYKVYIIIILLLIFVLGYNYILPSFDKYQSQQMKLSNMKLKMLDFESKKTNYQANNGLVDKIKVVEPQIISCVNTLQGCSELPSNIKNNFGIVRSYLVLNDMNIEKMSIDEKSILQNIDTFLLKKDPFNDVSRSYNGVLNKISIGDKQQFKDKLYLVPIELSITFENKDGLLSFIDNVEKKIPLDKSIRMLYKIDNISYDIVNSDEVQDASIFMYLYFYEE